MAILRLEAIIFMFIVLIKISCTQDLRKTITNTESFFNSIVKKYDNEKLFDKNKKMIDQEVDQHLKKVFKDLQVPRFKKEVNKPGIFSNLEEVLRPNISDVRDINFFKFSNGYEQWFSIILTSSNLIVYRHLDNTLEALASYNVINAFRAHVIKLYGRILLIVQKIYSIQIFCLIMQDGKLSIQEIRNFDIPYYNRDLCFWHAENQLLLGVASASEIYVYSWNDNNFNHDQIIPVSAKFLEPFQFGESMFLITSSLQKTSIFEYLSNTRQFAIIQSIERSFSDATILQLGKGVSREFFLALSNSKETILYKVTMERVFVPFQQISPADQIISTTKNNTALLMLLRDNVVDIYQYDGWRFIRLNFQLIGIKKLKMIEFKGEEHVLTQRDDDSWSLKRINWMRVEEPIHPNLELKQWCSAAKEKANKLTPMSLPELNKPIRIPKAQIQKLTVNIVNGISIEKMQNLTERYNHLISRLSSINESLSRRTFTGNPHFCTLRAKTVRTKCTKQCSAKKLKAKIPCDVAKMKKINDDKQSLRFEQVKVDTLDEFPCPKAGIKLEKINVKGSINGMSLDDLENNVLKRSGEQVVTGQHIFTNLHADIVNASSIDIASSFTRQKIKTTAIHANNFHLVDGGLLPLNGEPVTMTGTLNCSKAKFTGLIDLRAGIVGRNIKRISPMVYFQGYHELNGNYDLSNVVVKQVLAANDIARPQGKSLKEIAREAIPLSGNMPVRLALAKNSTVWTNITAPNLPKWLSRKNSQMVKVIGKKIALKDVKLSSSIYSSLPIPKVHAYVCSIGAISPDIKTSTIRIGGARAKLVKSINVFGAKKIDDVIKKLVTSLDQADLSKKIFTGFVTAENVHISDFENSFFASFQDSKFKWYQPNIFEGPGKRKHLKVASLTNLKGIKVPSPTEMSNLIVKDNFQIKTINGINFDEFIKHIVRINESVTMTNVTFEGHVQVDDIETANVNIDLQNLKKNTVYLGKKIISGDLEIEDDLSVPNILSFPLTEEVQTYVVEGSVTFKKEPRVDNINGKNLSELMLEIWMLDRPTILTGKLTMKNISVSQSLDNYNLLNTPTYGSWKAFENRLLSKTKLQNIEVPVYFRVAKILNIVTNGNSTLRSSDQDLNDLVHMTLKKNENLSIQDKFHFEELIIKDDMKLYGKINSLNFSSDVARYDVAVNNVTGKKIIDELKVRNLKGLNFSEWAKNVLMEFDIKQLITVNGRKTFNTLNARVLDVSGTFFGKKLEQCLMKIGNQYIVAPKIIKGSLHTPSMKIKGTINDVNLTEFTNNQLKKKISVQRIKSKMMFKGDLQILGDVTINGMFEGVELTKRDMINETFTPAMKAIAYLKPFANKIRTTIKHRAKFWDKFECIGDNTSLSVKALAPNINQPVHFDGLGECILTSSSEIECNKTSTFFLKMFTNSSRILINELLSIENVPIIVQISSGPKSRITIYMFNYYTYSFDIENSVRAPGICQAAVSIHNGVVWIVTRLKSQMLIVRYESWGDLQKYHLPDTRFFKLDRVPATNELILVREDGMWKLEGLAGPKHVFKATLQADSIETFSASDEFYVRLISCNSDTQLLRARYVGV